MTLTPDTLKTRLTDLGFQARLISTEAGVTVTRPCRHYRNRNGAYEMELELRPEQDGTIIRIYGPELGRAGQSVADDGQALLDVQSAFRFLRLVRDGGEVRPLLEYACLPSDSTLSDPSLTTLVSWAGHLFDPALGYLLHLSRTGQREMRFLAGDPPELTRLKDQARDLRTRLEETEREADRLRQSRFHSSLVLPEFI